MVRTSHNRVAFFDQQHPVPPARATLQSRLYAVLAEQADRARITRA